MYIKQFPKTYWDYSIYNPELYGYGEVDIFTDETRTIGERVSCIFRKKDLDKYSDDSCFDLAIAILCNDCGIESEIDELYGLVSGQIIPIQFNGKETPFVPIDWISKKLWL